MPLTLNGTTGEIFPSWTTAGRPSTPNQGQTGYNTTINTLETYDGSAWTPTGANPTITQTVYTSGSGTYTVPTGVKWLRVRMVGGGGGGQGSGTTQGTQPTSGGNTTFGTSFLTANGGSSPATFNGQGGSGGTASISGSASGITISGGVGGGSAYNFSVATGSAGGSGGSSALGGGGGGGSVGGPGFAAAANSGGGGGGGGGNNPTGFNSGPAGGAGGYIDAIISAPGSSYSYAVGSGGSAGAAGTSGYAGGAGGSGVIIIEEHYNW